MILNPYFSDKARALLAAIFVFGGLILQAQNTTETRWYFGNSPENLVFDRNGRDVNLETNQATPFGNAGAVTITDQFTGNLLFYTDGTQIFDASHNLVPNATSLTADPAINVPVVTAPVGNNPGQYYLFTNPGLGGAEILSSIVDATLDGNGSSQFPLGDLTIANQATGLTNPSEAMLIIPLGDGRTFWLLTQDRTNFEIRVTQITDLGLGATVNYNFTDGTNPGFLASHFAFNQDSSWLVMAPQTANRNIWFMTFDPTTGVPTFDRQLLGTGFNDGAGESVYDVEWSPDGSKLYLSRFGGAGNTANLYQIDFNDPAEQVNPILQNPINRSYGLKRAIDGRLYHLHQETNTSPFALGRINRPDSIPDSVNYQTMVFNNDFQARQFPEFTPAYYFTFDTLGFTYIDSCLSNVTKFFPVAEPVPDNIIWDFADGSGSNAFIPNHSYQTEGGYMVSMTASINGIDSTIRLPVEILVNDLMVDLGNDTTICVDEILTLDAGTGQSYVWNTGEISQTIDVDTAGTYWVEVTSTTGCTGFSDIEVTEYGVSNQLSNQWYFGEQAGIEFTGGAQAILDANNMIAAEGCATISDVNGELLFYTNGATVWNREHAEMMGGTLIGGDQPAIQSAMILPFNGDATMFYVFTTESVYGDGEYALRYSIVDMKEDNGLGEVIVKNIKLMDNSTERVTASGFAGNDFLLAHEFGNNTFRTYLTNANGLIGPLYSPIGEVHEFTNEQSATGYMKFSPTLAQVAVNIPGTNEVEIFDIGQGALSNPRLIDTAEPNLYGLEFSGAGTKLYLTTTGAGSKLIQYDLDSLNSADPVTDISATKFDGYPQGTDYGALQMGPDGIIYMAVDNSGMIGTINATDGNDAGAGFNASGFDLQGRTSRLGLPNFAQNQSPPQQLPSMTVTVGCAGQESVFTGVGRDNNIENYLWIFGDGQSSIDQTTTHTYDNPGIYTVQLELSNRCDVDTILTQMIEIFNIPEQPMVPADTAICDQPIVLSAWDVDNPDFAYYWSTGETTREITVSNPAIIDVAIINLVTGCSSDTLQVFIANAGPTIDLGADRVLCQDDPQPTLDSQVGIGIYAWSIDGVVSGNNRTFDIITTTAGTFEYTVEVTNSIGCIGRDTLQVTILPGPDISVVGNAPSNCNVADGSFDITFNVAGSYTYQATGPTPFGPLNFDGPGTANVPGLASGNYILNTTNIITGCSVLSIAQIEDLGLGLTATAPAACIGDGTIDLAFAAVPNNFNVSILYEDGSTILDSNLTNAFTNPVVQNLDTGTYSIAVRDLAFPNCVETETVRIVLAAPFPTFTFNAIQEICGTSGTLTVADGTGGAAIYTWAGPGIVGTNIGTSITVDQAGIYTVTGDDPGALFCPLTETITANFNNNPVVNVAVTGDSCEGQVVLEANVTGGSGLFNYVWSDGSNAQQNTVSVTGSYTVTINDQLTGCSIVSTPVDITIEPTFEVLLSASPDCDNNGNVFLIATTNYFDPSISYEWRNGNGEVLSGSDSIITITLSDQYSVIATNETGTCTATDIISVAVVPINPEDLRLPQRATFCSGDPVDPTVDLDPGIFNTYEWRLLPDPAVISTDQVLNVATEGTYEVTIFNGFTCITDIVEVVEDCRPTVHAPNAFSPNGNGINEEFFVFPNDYVETFEIFIYSRWGELVYHSDSQDFRWDGYYRGKLLPGGTFAWVAKFSSSLEPELGTIEQYGSVTLVR